MSEEEPPTPQSTEPLALVVLDQSKDAYDAARDQADAQLVEELGEGGHLKKFLNGIWKGNIAKEFYRQKYIHSALDQIEDTQNVLTHETGISAESRSRAIDATIERFQSEHDEMVHSDAGEKREIHNDESDIASAFKSMIRSYAEGHLNDTTLREERTRFMQAYRETHDEVTFGEGLVTTDNMMEVARAVMGAVEHGESIDHVMAHMQVITGEARSGVRTEANYNRVDKVIDKITKTKIGSIIGPEAVMTAVTVVAIATKWGSHSVVGAALKTIAPGAGAGIWAGLRENKRVKDERTQHSREAAMGKQFDQHAVRRQEMEATRYESVSAQALTETIRATGNAEQLDSGNEALQAALDSLAQVQSRIDLSNQRNIDLISYSDVASVGDERMALDLARAEVRVALEGKLTPEVRAELGLSAEQSVREMIEAQSTQYIELLDEDISAKDRAFKILKAKRVAKSVAIGVATGLIGGTLLQEGIAAFDPMRAGLIEQAWGAHNVISADGSQHQTLLEGFVEGKDRVLHTDHSNIFDSYDTSKDGHGSLNLSNDHKLVQNGDGTVNFVDPNGHDTIKNLAVNADGSLPQASIDRLDAAGMKVEDHSFNHDVTVTKQEQVTSDQFVQNHLAETTHVKRDLWYGNDTPNVYDKNELRMYWGGNGGLTDGGYQLSAAGMKPGGSYEGGQSVDWNKAAVSGNLFMSISANVDSQTQTFMVPIGPDGAVNIAADSPAGHFFANVNGHAQFTGAYAEVVQTTGVDAEGIVHMRPLATLVGKGGHNPVADTITTTTTEHHANYTITTEGYDTTVQNYTEAAPGVPIESRRSMEAPASRTKTGKEGRYGLSAEQWDSQLERWGDERSPRLKNDPNAILQPGEELDFYYDEQIRRRGEAYVQELEARIDNSPALSSLDAEARAIVVMPVAAANESENIYHVLSLYAQQDEEAKKQTTILLNLNWMSDAEADPDKKAKIEKTLAEVERARIDFPDVQIASFTKVWDRDWADNVRKGSIYGEVIKTLYDTAALATRRAMKAGRLSADQDVLMITNDADALGMHRHYLQHYIASEAEHKESDAYIGTIRWGVDVAKQYPGYHTSQLFMQSMNIATTRATGHGLGPATIGPNSAFRMSIYAAMGGCEDGNAIGVGADSMLGRKVLAARGRLPKSNGLYSSPTIYEGSLRPGVKNRVIRQVIGSDIDSAPERLLDGGYRKGKFIPDAWGGFDAGETRDGIAGNTALIGPEDPVNDFESIRERVEKQISGFITNWYPDRGVATFTLSMLFPDIKLKGGGIDTSWDLKKQPDDSYAFTFTKKGAERFRNSLRRDVKGHFDPIGSRLQRRLYGKVGKEAAKQPLAMPSPLARAL